MSTVPRQAHASAAKKTAMIVAPMARPIGEGGVSTTSSAAGRNSTSSLRRASPARATETTALADFINSRLQAVEHRILPAGAEQCVVSALLDDAPALDRDDAIGVAQGREPVGDDEHGAPVDDLLHVLLDLAFARVIETAGRL